MPLRALLSALTLLTHSRLHLIPLKCQMTLVLSRVEAHVVRLQESELLCSPMPSAMGKAAASDPSSGELVLNSCRSCRGVS